MPQAFFYEIEPGDATKYSVFLTRRKTGDVFVAIGSGDFISGGGYVRTGDLVVKLGDFWEVRQDFIYDNYNIEDFYMDSGIKHQWTAAVACICAELFNQYGPDMIQAHVGVIGELYHGKPATHTIGTPK